jgi:bacillithiol system protein YtxJ
LSSPANLVDARHWALTIAGAPGGEIPLIDIQGAEGDATSAATRTGVEHESPQVIVLRGGEAVWNVSRAEITAEGVAAAVREHA